MSYNYIKFLIVVAVATALGLLASIGMGVILSYQGTAETGSLQADVVYAYLKTYNISENVSGLYSEKLVSYILVLNISNPTDKDVYVHDLRVELSGAASKVDRSVESTNITLRIKRTFNEAKPLLVSKNSEQLVPFTATDELSNLGLEPLKQGKGYFIVAVSGDSVGSGLSLKEATLETVSEDEYVYNTAFTNGCFRFSNYNLMIQFESSS